MHYVLFNSQERQSTFASQGVVPIGSVSPFCEYKDSRVNILGEVETLADKEGTHALRVQRPVACVHSQS